MTKRRTPLSEHHAVRTILDRIGVPEAARVTGRHPRTVEGWSDPDRRGEMPTSGARLLDRAFLAAGGDHPPIACAYLAELRLIGVELFYRSAARAEIAARAALEGGQASAACIEAYAGRDDRDALLDAERETEEAFVALAVQLYDIRRQLGAHGIVRAW